MKAHLMYRDRDFDFPQNLMDRIELPAYRRDRDTGQEPTLSPYETALLQDLELETLLASMARGDQFVSEVAKKALLASLGDDIETIGYRQNVLTDCLERRAVLRDIYALTVELIEKERKIFLGILRDSPGTVLNRSLEVMRLCVDVLKRLRRVADQHGDEFTSEGFKTFFAMLRGELGDDYFAAVDTHLKRLQFPSGVLVSAELGKGNKGAEYTLRTPPIDKWEWMKRLFDKKRKVYSVYIAPRDEAGARALGELHDRGVSLAASVLAQSADHIVSFFRMLRTELAFYVGCVNLHEHLGQIGEPTTFPQASASDQYRFSCKELYDVCLALHTQRRVVGNDVAADGKQLAFITGANTGGKSTFLRSVGLAQLMMQSGMFVAAEAFAANVVDRLFTHYKREEDTAMKSGKLDEELDRMSDIIDQVTPNSILLFNESFAATNEHEGSEIAGQIVRALLEKGVKVFFVTHFYELAHGFYEKRAVDAIFLLAERREDGTRTFKLSEGEPQQTSYGIDLYKSIFTEDATVQIDGTAIGEKSLADV